MRLFILLIIAVLLCSCGQSASNNVSDEATAAPSNAPDGPDAISTINMPEQATLTGMHICCPECKTVISAAVTADTATTVLSINNEETVIAGTDAAQLNAALQAYSR